MSQLYHLYVADESEADEICENPGDRERAKVPGFDEDLQLSLLSLFQKVEHGRDKYQTYHRYFELLCPSEAGEAVFVAKFPDDLVRQLGNLNDDAISSLVTNWMNTEKSFSEYGCTRKDGEELLNAVSSTCKTALKVGKKVLYRFSL